MDTKAYLTESIKGIFESSASSPEEINKAASKIAQEAWSLITKKAEEVSDQLGVHPSEITELVSKKLGKK